MYSELLLYLHQYFSISLFSNNFFSDHMKVYFVPKCNSKRKQYIRSPFTENSGCLTANSPTNNRIVNNFWRI